MLVSSREWCDGSVAGQLAGAEAMRDIDVRAALMEALLRAHVGEPETVIVDEFGLCQGDARVDLAVVNGVLNGFEIKSDRDNLDRLPAQQEVYSKVLNAVTIVAGRNHVQDILAMVPGWWEIWEARWQDDHVVFSILRSGRQNPQIDGFALAQLLWRDEALSIISELDLATGISRKPRRELWRILAASLSSAELGHHVCRRIKCRTNWRSAT